VDVAAAAEALFDGRGARWVDMTHTLDEENVYWPTARRFQLETVMADTTGGGWWYAANEFSAAEHGGTHFDAPYHFAAGGWAAHQVPLEALRGPAAVIDVRDSARANPDYRVTVADLRAWEADHGRLPEGAVVLIDSGWQERWPEEERVLGTAERGPAATDDLHFPGLHPEAARWLVENRDVDLVGLDTPSIDHGPSRDFMSHRILYEANVVGLENVANLDRLPPSGAYVLVLPMKIRGGSGGPARVVGIVPEGAGSGGG
jgi:kynurenine formamidase